MERMGLNCLKKLNIKSKSTKNRYPKETAQNPRKNSKISLWARC